LRPSLACAIDRSRQDLAFSQFYRLYADQVGQTRTLSLLAALKDGRSSAAQELYAPIP
jgi:hypothetical protein